MCGRYTLSTPVPVLAELLGLTGSPELRPRYNVAPTQDVPAVRVAAGARELVLLRWGLVPSWRLVTLSGPFGTVAASSEPPSVCQRTCR
jgi:putative SOS response-associated peptidase YedK